MQAASIQLQQKALEYSKVIFGRFCWFFLAQMLLTYAMIPLGYEDAARRLLDACIPLYQAVALAYFGKAGMENVSKIVTTSRQIATMKQTDETENG